MNRPERAVRGGSARVMVLLMAMAAIALAGYFALRSSDLKDLPSSTIASPPSRTGSSVASIPPIQAVTPHVSALGRLEPAGTVLRIQVPSGNEGARIESLLVAEGDPVVAGQVVAITDAAARRRAAVDAAQSDLQVASARLAQVQAGAKRGEIAAAEAQLRAAKLQESLAERQWKRAVALQDNAAGSAEDVDQRRIEHLAAIESRIQAEALVESTREVRDVDVAVESARVAAAKAAIDRAEVDFDATQVRAPSQGKVLKIHTRPGEQPAALGLLEMGMVDRMQAVAEVYEADLARVQLGQPAQILLESNRVPLRGTVVEIGNIVARKVVLTNDPISDTDARVVEVRIEIDPADIPTIIRLANARVEVVIGQPAGAPQSGSPLANQSR
jgi:HlyD family secretion protein